MPSKKSITRLGRPQESERRSSRSAPKFIPNLKQINEAAKELPDPDLWPEPNYLCPVKVDGKQRSIEFTLKTINRGKEQAPRWIYEGKVLVRKRDA